MDGRCVGGGRDDEGGAGVEDRGELMKGSVVGKLDAVEECPLGADTSGAANESAVMEGGKVFDRVRGVDRV